MFNGVTLHRQRLQSHPTTRTITTTISKRIALNTIITIRRTTTSPMFIRIIRRVTTLTLISQQPKHHQLYRTIIH